MTDINLMTADSLEGTIEMSPPALSLEEAKQKIVQWVARQDRFWPDELTPDLLASNLQEIYAAHWVLSGQAEGVWSASIGTDHKKVIICSTCNGKGRAPTIFNGMSDNAECTTCDGGGRVEKTETLWNNQSGFAHAVLQGKVIENVADNTPIRCGERDMKASGQRMPKPLPATISVLRPETTHDEAGLSLADQQVRLELENDAKKQASDLGYVRNLRITNVQTANVNAYTWLYPIYAGNYTYNEKSYLIEVDGITGELSIPQPGSVVVKRVILWVGVTAVAIAVIFGVGLLLGWW